MSRRLYLPALVAAGLLQFVGATPAHADAGNLDFIVLGEAGFSGNNNPGNTGYYTTGVNSYSLTGNLGYWFDDNWEAGFGAGPGRVDYQNCNASNACLSTTQTSTNVMLFGRYNFTPDDGGSYSFTGLQFIYIHTSAVLGSVSELRPVAGYRLPLNNDWWLELSVGAGVPVAGNTAGYSTNYDVQIGLVIPL